MTILKPRSRMISVRLSEDEYDSLRLLCTATGARSVSELTRDAMHSLLRASSQEKGLGNNLDDFKAQISTLDRKIEALSERMALPATEVKR